MHHTSAYPTAQSVEDFQLNLAAVQARIAAACARVNRDPTEIHLLPVSKTVPEDRVRLAYAAGCHELGENKVQEAQRKAEALSDLDNLRWSIIGHLQTNKAKYVARFANEFQALDKLSVAEALDRQLQARGRALNVLIQVNTSGESSKFGLTPESVGAFLHQLSVCSSLRIRGLMTLAQFSADPIQVRSCFKCLRELRDRLRDTAPSGVVMQELSMGMSGDFELAVEEGATVLRIGQAIFGTRALPDTYYWPDSPKNPSLEASSS